MGGVTTSSQTTFSQAPEVIYGFITNPSNWTKTYPGSTHIKGLPDTLPLKVGDVWTEAGPDGSRLFTWQLALATPPNCECSPRIGGWAMTRMTTAA